MNSWKDEASTSSVMMNNMLRSRAEIFDIVAAVKGLHELNAQELIKLVRDSGNNVVRHIAEDGSPIQVDLEKFARYLPLHLTGVIMGWEREKSTFKYLLCGILLLHSMCDLASQVPKIEQVLLVDVKVSEQLIDLVFYLLVLLGAYRQENHQIPNDIVLLHSALVACSLKLLTVIVSPLYQEVAQVLTAYYKADIFMDAAFSAVCIDVKYLRTKLSVEQADSVNTSPTDEETLNHLCRQCDSSLQFLQSLCQEKLFQERIVQNKDLCGNGGVLRLVHTVMDLKITPAHNASSPYIASVSRLKSRVLSILLFLCEAENVSYLDEVASNPRGRILAKSTALQTEALAAIFLLPHAEFVSAWCSSDVPVSEDDATLDVPQSYAHQRTSLLIKVIANLHCFEPAVCQDERDLFFSKFIRFLRKGPQRLSDGSSSTFDAERTTTVCTNLCFLLRHAESLIKSFLNKDDVHLLRLFVDQFQSLIVPAASVDCAVQDTKIREVPRDHGNDDTNMEEGAAGNTVSKEDQLDVSGNGNYQSTSGERKCVMMEEDKSGGATINLRESERDARTVETSGSDSTSTRGKNSVDLMDVDHMKGSGCEENVEDEKVDAIHSDEKQQRKRKRTIMNDKQIALIESALVDEPDMHRNLNLLRLWADKLSHHGAEVTTSRLKNWLNNRKARLARAAKDARLTHEGEKLERQGGSGQFDSPLSPVDDIRVPSVAIGSTKNEVIDTVSTTLVDNDSGTSLAAPRNVVTPNSNFEPGQWVVLLGDEAKRVGKGKVFQVHGTWCERELDGSGTCVVDIVDLSICSTSKLPHPLAVTGDTFDQTEKKLGTMQVLWDLDKLSQLP